MRPRSFISLLCRPSAAVAAFIIFLAACALARPALAQSSPPAGDSLLGPEASPASAPAPRIPRGLLEQVQGLGYEIYQVRRGDTVENVAARFGVRPEQVRGLNRLSPDAVLEPGQSLAIPVPTLAAPPSDRRQQRGSPADSAASAEPAAPLPEPRCALVTSSSPILSEPSSAGETLYEPLGGSKLIITAETEHFWGLVMIDGSTGWIAKSALQLTNQTVSSQQVEVMLRGGRPEVVQEALRYLGTPYCYGGRAAGTLDCSLLVQRVFAARGTPLPRTAAAQFEVGQRVGYGQLLPGDRVYFISGSGRVNHAGIYIGEGRFIHASSRRGCVAVDRLTDRAYWPRFIGACRS